MGLNLGKIKDGILAQVNPFDGGKTWSNPQGTPQPTQPKVSNSYYPNPPKQPPGYLPDSFKGLSKAADNISYKAAEAQNTFKQYVGRGIKGFAEALNPFDNESKGNNLINDTMSAYGATPEFKSILDRTNPYVVNENEVDSGGDANFRVGGTYRLRTPGDNLQSRLNINNTMGKQSEDVMLHEGLHAAYDTASQQNKDEFLNIAQRVLPQSIAADPANGIVGTITTRDWLENRVKNYKDPNKNMSDLRALSPSMQHEVHSYLPEYYEMSRNPMPDELKQYYSKYYTPGRLRERERIANQVANAVSPNLDYTFSEDY